MTSSLLQPRSRARDAVGGPVDCAGSTAPTPVLDWRHPRVAALLDGLDAGPPAEGPDTVRRLTVLRLAHRRITTAVRPVYSVREDRPVSQVLRRGRGSCSQRLAVLEAVARSAGVATRVRGLLVDGRFWYPRFPGLHRIVPDQVVLAWPEFRIRDAGPGTTARWLPVSELFGTIDELSVAAGGGFSNDGPETLFEALSRTAVDWDGATACPTTGPTAGCDLSAHVLRDLGRYDSREELFARYGQTLCRPVRLLAEPVLGRRRATGA